MRLMVIQVALVCVFSTHRRCCAMEGAADDKAMSVASAACIAFQANCTELQTYKCRFLITKAGAASVEKALLEEYSDPRRCEYILAVDRDKRRFETITQVDLTRPKNEGLETVPGGRRQASSRSIDFLPVAHLEAGQEGLVYFAPWNEVSLIAKDEPPVETAIETPLTMCRWSVPIGLPALQSLRERGLVTLASRGQVEIDRHRVVHAEFELTVGDKSRFEFYFDPSRGYLPLRIDAHNISMYNKRRTERQTHVLEAKDLGRGRWFPVHIVSFTVPDDKAQRIADVVDVKVLEVTDKVKDQDLSLKIPAGTVITWRRAERHNLESFRLRQDEIIGTDDFARLEHMLAQSRATPLMDTAVKNQDTPGTGRWYLIGAGLVLLCLSVAVYRRRRGRR